VILRIIFYFLAVPAIWFFGYYSSQGTLVFLAVFAAGALSLVTWLGIRFLIRWASNAEEQAQRSRAPRFQGLAKAVIFHSSPLQRVYSIVTELAVVLGITVVGLLFAPIESTSWESEGRTAVIEAERETVRAAIQAFMVGNDLDTVTPSTSGAGGGENPRHGRPVSRDLKPTGLLGTVSKPVLLQVGHRRPDHVPI